MPYTIGGAAKRMGLAPSTLRYYDKEGLLPFVERSAGGIRVFKDSDFEWLALIECLKKTGMSLSDIKHFVEMAMCGDETIEERLELITKQKKAVQARLKELSSILNILEYKEWYYKTAKKDKTTEYVRNMTSEQIPREYAEARKVLGKE